MVRRSFGSVLFAALIAGVLAGLAVGIFHLIGTEPVIQQAIDLEDMLSQAAGQPSGPELVSRSAQRIGLIIGFLLYGAVWGLIFGLIYWFLRGRMSGRHARRQTLGLALVGYWVLGIFPLLKYPANPPGVGDPATIGYRQGLYFSFLALSLIGALLVSLVYRDLGRVGQSWQRPSVRVPIVAIFSLMYAGALTLLMPDNPDPVPMPPQLVARFRWLSMAGITVFWLVLGGTFVLLAHRWTIQTSEISR